MKAKYKIGTLVETTSGHGVVDSVITCSDGFLYGMKGNELNAAIAENDILAAYRPVVARGPRKAKSEKKSKTKVAA